MNKFKVLLSVLFFILGLSFAYSTYELLDKDSFGKIESKTTTNRRSANSIAITGSGVDSSNDGVAVGFGIISGFSFLSSVLLLTSIQKTKNS